MSRHALRRLAILALGLAISGLALGATVADGGGSPSPAPEAGRRSSPEGTATSPSPSVSDPTPTVTVTCPEPPQTCEPPPGVEPDPAPAALIEGRGVQWWHWQAVRHERRAERLRRQVKRYRSLAGLARKIDRGLQAYGSPIRGRDAVAAGVRSGVNPVALVAISGVESGFGRAACGYNSTGLGACSRAWTEITLCGERWTLAWITSWYRGLRMTGELIRCLFPGAKTPHDLVGYCSDCAAWPYQVAGIMRQFGSSAEIRGAQ